MGSTYTPLNGAGTHASSDWQVYEADVAALSTSVITAASEQEGAWTSSQLSPFQANVGLWSVAYDESVGTYVAVQQTGQSTNQGGIWYSTDGKTWQASNLANPGTQIDISWGGVGATGTGLFVAVLTNNQLTTIKWTTGIYLFEWY